MRTVRSALLVLVAWSGLQCFPDLPDEGLIDNLRVLAVQADPATAVLDTWPAPTITVTALVVEPDDEDLSGAAHGWSLALDEDMEGNEVLQAMVPDPPHGTSVVIDPGAAMSRSGEFFAAMLPLQYVVTTADDSREAMKLVSFFVPDWEAGDDDSAAPTGDDELPEGHNVNPSFASITFDDGVALGADDLPGIAGPVYAGEVDPALGLRIAVEVADDKDPEDVEVDLYWTGGCPGLPPDEDTLAGRGAGAADGECPDTDAGWGESSTRIGDMEQGAEFGWTPPDDVTGVRLFVVLLDAEGGQAWQEIRPMAAP